MTAGGLRHEWSWDPSWMMRMMTRMMTIVDTRHPPISNVAVTTCYVQTYEYDLGNNSTLTFDGRAVVTGW